MSGSMTSWFWMWPVLVVVGLGMLGYAAVLLTRQHAATEPETPSPARRALDERYARGETDHEQYRGRRGELR